MNGLLIKTTTVICALLSTIVLSSLCFANTFSKDEHTTDRLHRKQGCMMCHQGESMPSDETPEK